MKAHSVVRSLVRDAWYGLLAYVHPNYIIPNAPDYLSIRTYDGSDQVVHPDIYYDADGWNDYCYWLALTPFPNGNDRLENPSIYASEDGINWVTPGKLSNPITQARACGYHSDPDIVVTNNVMRIYYRYNPGDGTTILNMKESGDGINWSEEKVVFTIPSSSTFASPALIVKDGNHLMYAVDTVAGAVTLRRSQNGVDWETPITLFHSAGIWHIDVLYNSGMYYMIYMKKPHGQLFFAESDDGLDWRRFDSPVLGPSRHGWDNRWIYRSSFSIENAILRVWYSARSRQNEWHMGLTSIDFDQFKESLAKTNT